MHKAYLESFAEYRKLLRTTSQLDTNSPILDRIKTDNLFTADQRVKVFELAKAAEDDMVGAFVNSIYRYLVDARVVNPLAQEHDPDLVYTQLWRQSLLGELNCIFSENWRAVIDTSPSRPPLNEEQIQLEIDLMFKEFNISSTDTGKNEKLKHSLGIKALDNIVHEMQSAYQEVTAEYNKLKKNLSQ